MSKVSDKRTIGSKRDKGHLQESNMFCGLDMDKYLPYAENWDMTLEQKREALKSLVVIVQRFVDQAWDTSDKA